MNKEISEIARLADRISKDPKSKLFVPLAEEYKKAGDLEMAIQVLLEGLENNPGYVTARAFLGKLLLAKGDLGSAQKEFEEVVKTIPDNLMARRKLGDLLILQNRPHDALTHYRIALSLNPGDGEFASLISDVEAGRDVRSKIQPSKAQSSAEQAVKQEPSAAAREPAPASIPPQASKVEPVTQVEIPVAAQAAAPLPFAEAAPASPMTETEEPEEVLIVEPLESEAFKELDVETTPPGVFEETAVEELFELETVEEVSEKALEKTLEDVLGKSDDFTTDTLAELYIAQGFHEKAVEIYERMLVDKPDSRGLKDKLAGVRATAARSAAPAAEEKKEPDIFAEQEAREYLSSAAAGAGTVEPSVFDEPNEFRPREEMETGGFQPEAFAEAREYVPPVEPEEQPTAGGEAGFDALAPTPVDERTRTRPRDTDFEPREYIPAKTVLEPFEPAAAKGKPAQKPSASGRKETITRLEAWLTNIKKEN